MSSPTAERRSGIQRRSLQSDSGFPLRYLTKRRQAVSLRVLTNPWLALVAGIAVHGLGMSVKYRLEARDGPPLWWERLLFWLCWAMLVGMVGWISFDAFH